MFAVDASGRKVSLLNSGESDEESYSATSLPRLSISRGSSFSDSSASPPSTFSSTASLQHIFPARVRRIRKYSCGCGKTFTTSGHLARHTRIHTGEKNFLCPQPGCGARFSRQDNAKQHYLTHSNAGGRKGKAKQRDTGRSQEDFVDPLSALADAAVSVYG